MIREIRRGNVAADDSATDSGWDYADSFEIWLTGDDTRTAEQWARAALENSPAIVRAIIVVAQARLLRLDLGPRGAPGHVLGWQIVTCSADEIRLAASGPLLAAVITGRRIAADGFDIRTYLYYRDPKAAKLWRVIGPLHRRIAPYLLRRAALA